MGDAATTVLLVRHATHDRVDRVLCGRMPDVCLGPGGMADARRLAERLAVEPIRAVHSSPLERTRQTAEALAERLDLPVRMAPELLEIDFGDWTGRTFEELESDPAWRLWNAARSRARAPGGETMAEVQARVVTYIESLRARHAGECVVLVSHGDVLRAALLHCLRMSIDDYHRLEISPASVSAIVTWGGGAKVLAMNEVVR